MITYEIKPKVVSIMDTARRWLGYPLIEQPKPILDYVPWGKVQYTMWIEEIKKEWKVNELVTLRQFEPVENRLPPIFFVISYINEILHHSKWDEDIQQPIALVCLTSDGRYLNKCPAVLRHFTAEENALVDLQNSKSAGTA